MAQYEREFNVFMVKYIKYFPEDQDNLHKNVKKSLFPLYFLLFITLSIFVFYLFISMVGKISQ